MLTAYFDETGDEAHPVGPLVGVGGAIASVEQWDKLETGWREILDGAGVPNLHMREFTYGCGCFEGWEEPRRRALLGPLLDLIVENVPTVCGAAISKSAMRGLDEEQRVRLGPAYRCGLRLCLEYAISYATSVDDKVQVFVEGNNTFGGEPDLCRQLITMQAEQSGIDPKHVVGVASQNEYIVPLQVADLIAYEMYKELDRRVSRPGDSARYPYTQLERIDGLFRFMASTERLLLEFPEPIEA